MDQTKQIKIGLTCHCKFNLSLRNTIELGLKPVLESVTRTIAATLTNDDFFGKYAVEYLFILNEFFPFAYNSPNYKAFIRVFQEAIDSGIQSKEKDTPTFVLEESLCQLMQPAMNQQPYMYDSFITGNLQQVSSGTYALIIGKRMSKFFLSCKTYNGNDTIKISEVGSAIVVLKKGQLIPDTGINIKFDIGHCIKTTGGLETMTDCIDLRKWLLYNIDQDK